LDRLNTFTLFSILELFILHSFINFLVVVEPFLSLKIHQITLRQSLDSSDVKPLLTTSPPSLNDSSIKLRFPVLPPCLLYGLVFLSLHHNMRNMLSISFNAQSTIFLSFETLSHASKQQYVNWHQNKWRKTHECRVEYMKWKR
jgi:hypothetical protein